MNIAGKSKVRYELHATVTRADGTVHELGAIASTGWRGTVRAPLAWLRIKRANRYLKKRGEHVHG